VLRVLAFIPGLIWLLFPAGVCICATLGVPEPGTSQKGAPSRSHAPWCTANKDNVPVDRADEEIKADQADQLIATLPTPAEEAAPARRLGALADPFTPWAFEPVATRLIACVWIE
jgi:hypothetical protein